MVLEAHTRRQGPDTICLVLVQDIVDNFDDPVIVVVTDGGVSVTRDLVVEFGDWCGHWVRVQVTSGRCVVEPNDVAVLQVPNRSLRVVRGFVPSR